MRKLFAICLLFGGLFLAGCGGSKDPVIDPADIPVVPPSTSRSAPEDK